MTWTIEFRPELLSGERFEVMENSAHRGTFGSDVEAHVFARDFAEEHEIVFVNWPDDRAAVQLDPLVSMDNRATVAEQMLDQYCLLKMNLRIRESIHRNLHNQGATSLRTGTAYHLVVQAQAELDQCKYEILELMGVDS